MKSGFALMIPATLFVIGTAFALAQQPETLPGAIRLLPGFTHQLLRGIDTQVGKISRKDGLTIGYDIGELAGNYAEFKKTEYEQSRGRVGK